MTSLLDLNPLHVPDLRPYQVDAVDAMRAAFAAGRRAPCYQLPTGAGKTIVFAHIARAASQRGTQVLILVHRRELLLQGSRALRSVGLPHGLIAATLPPTVAAVQIASVQTLVRRLEHVTPPDLIVVDEAHHAVAGSWRRVLSTWPRARVLGVTATPARLDGKGLGLHAGGVFDDLVLGPSVKELTRDGWLVPAEVYAPPMKADLSELRTTAGDFNKHDVVVRMNRPTVTGDAVEHYSRLGGGRPGIAFCSSVEHALHVAEAFSAAGVPSEPIDGSMGDSQRDAVLRRFGSGATRILTSCEIVSEGFDLPEVAVAILLRPTKSLTLFLQQVGRALRPADGKDHATVLDHVGNVERHGLPDQDRPWSLDGVTKRKGPPPMRRCPECFACHAPAPVCPACGHVYAADPANVRHLQHVSGELQRVAGDVALWEVTRERMRRHQQEQAQCTTVEELEVLGYSRGYGNPEWWARRVWFGRTRRSGARMVTA